MTKVAGEGMRAIHYITTFVRRHSSISERRRRSIFQTIRESEKAVHVLCVGALCPCLFLSPFCSPLVGDEEQGGREREREKA